MSRRVLIGISAVLVNCIVLRSPAMPQASCKLALQDYRVAVQTYQDGLFDPAMAGFEAYLKQCPDGPYAGQAHYVLATLYDKRSESAKVLPHVQKALSHQLDAKVRSHVLWLGAQSALQAGQPGVARDYLHEVVTAKVDSSLQAPAFYWLGEIAYRQQEVEAAQRYYQRAVKESPTGPYAPHAYYSLGWLARQRGDTQAALDAFNTFLQVASKHEFATQVRFARADLLRETGNIKAAATAFRQLAQERPASLHDEALFRWAEMAYQLQQYDEARMAYGQLLKLFPKSDRASEALYGLGWTALRQQQCEAAVEAWQTLLQRDPDVAQAPDIHYHLGQCYIQLAQYPAARRHLKLVLASQTETERQREAVLKLATLAFRAQDYAEAIQYYSQALEMASPDNAFRLHYLLGESHHAAGATADAIRHWQQALQGPQSLPFYAQVLYRLGAAYLAQQDWHKAIPALRQLWDVYPQFGDRPAVAAGLAQAYGQTRQCEEALRFYAAIADSPAPGTDPQAVLRARVACWLTLAQYEEIIALLAPALAAEAPEIMEAPLLYALGQAYMQRQQFEAALQPFDLLKQRFPQSSLVRHMLPPYAFALEKSGRTEEALAAWQTVLQQAGIKDEAERHRLQLYIGRLALQERRFDEALTWLRPTRESAGPDVAVEAWYWSAEVFRQQQQWGQATHGYQKVLQRYPAEAHWVALARLRLGMIYEVQQEWEQALEIYRILRDTATDTDVIANAQRRIAAIQAGRVLRRPAPATPSKEG